MKVNLAAGGGQRRPKAVVGEIAEGLTTTTTVSGSEYPHEMREAFILSYDASLGAVSCHGPGAATPVTFPARHLGRVIKHRGLEGSERVETSRDEEALPKQNTHVVVAVHRSADADADA
ncbi:hypothetical protein CSOJ01_06760 [Colletotrichum sojae]|uniref:Uncharacterized protein n=1 Tax=Colletotrichum sojae TaxID=2175907 RepID=A0A8H6MVF1_9PEZI|nr:hypothetical protein CSOJ01_06760 [Colletotrichum sojae]